MNIKKIELEYFRNYKNLELIIDSEINIFFGNNGQGKTNLLEAIYMCSCLRSHRTPKDTDLIFYGKDFYRVCLSFSDQKEKERYLDKIDISYEIANIKKTGFGKNTRKMRYNETEILKNSELVGIFNSVIFAPEDLNIIKEGPSARRRFLDLMISQTRITYFKNLSLFQKVLSQRNSLLKQIRDKEIKKGKEQIYVWDEAFAEISAKIISTRLYFSDLIDKLAGESHEKISFGKEKISVKYRSVPGITLKEGKKEIKEKLLNKLKTNINEDIEKGSTTYGPHRDDLEITMEQRAVKLFASQGQQRTAVLSIKIAELEIIKKETGKCPVLLLDDVMSELDGSRRKTLLESIGDVQIFITCTDKNQVEKNFGATEDEKRISYYEVSDGKVFKC